MRKDNNKVISSSVSSLSLGDGVMKKDNYKVISKVRINNEYWIIVELDDYGWYRIFDCFEGEEKKQIRTSDSFLVTASFFVRHVEHQREKEKERKRVQLF